jgi:ABC-type nitrate/sulfonate/bicarbonate transport system permease component
MIDPPLIHGDVETAEVAAARHDGLFARVAKGAGPVGIVSMFAGIFTLGITGTMLDCIFGKIAQHVLRWRGINVETGQCER